MFKVAIPFFELIRFCTLTARVHVPPDDGIIKQTLHGNILLTADVDAGFSYGAEWLMLIMSIFGMSVTCAVSTNVLFTESSNAMYSLLYPVNAESTAYISTFVAAPAA